MEKHDPDPTAPDEQDPWERFSSEFSTLSDQVKAIYRGSAGDDSPDEEEVRQAFATLAGAWERVAETAVTALRDERTRESLKAAASSLAAALGATLSGLGDELIHPEEE